MLSFFDAHCHLPEAGDETPTPPESEIAVCGRILCGVEPAEWARLADAAEGWPGTVAAYGVHPWYALNASGNWPGSLEARLEADPAAWLGEAGLDGLKLDSVPRETQERVFAEQLRLAARLGRPVNLHCVKAWDGLVRLLDAEYLTGGEGRPFIVHSFSGPHQFIKKLTERGAYFSVGQLFSRHDSRRHRERTALLPDDRLLLESDAFVEPGVDAAGDLRHALDWLAAVRRMPVAALAGLLLENSRRMLSHG